MTTAPIAARDPARPLLIGWLLLAALPAPAAGPVDEIRVERVKRTGPDPRDLTSADGKARLVASGDTARLWDAARKRPLGPPMEHGDVAIVGALALSPDGRRAATGLYQEARLWDPVEGAPLGRFLVLKQWVVSALAFSPDGRLLATGITDLPGDTGEVWVWDVAARTALRKISVSGMGPIRHLAFGPDGRTLRVDWDRLGGP